MSASTHLVLRYGFEPSAEHHLATRLDDSWSIEPFADRDRLVGITTVAVPDDPAWRAWVDPTVDSDDAELDATAARVTSWVEGLPVTTGLTPADHDAFVTPESLPRGWAPAGLDLAVSFVLTGAPGGSLVATWVWEDGVLRRQASAPPVGLPESSYLQVRAPLAAVLRYLNGATSIYSVLSTGSSITGNPSMIQFFAGYLEVEGFAAAQTPHQRHVRRLLADFLAWRSPQAAVAR